MARATFTFLFTDIEGSTQLWERDPQGMPAALARHDALLAAAVAAHQGQIIKRTGDGCLAVFTAALDGVAATLTAQQALATEAWPELQPDALRVRMALHTGEAEPRDGDYYGPALNRAARLMAAGHGGQVLLSQTVASLVDDGLPLESALRDLGEHRLKDLTRPEHIFQLSAPGLPADFPPLRSLDAGAHNLPVQLTHFIGRERELAEVRRLLSETALLTLTGSGGTGKTRLSLQVAAEVLDAFSDGVWLVELAPITDPALVVQTIAATLGARQQPSRSLFDSLSDFLSGKQLLLVLDNCEHLIAACAELAERLLRQCSRLKLLASSREALGISGETTYPVPSLSLPEAAANAAALTIGTLNASEAVRLFVDRAQTALPGFTLSDENAAATATICRRLDGIPLAIELAAARVRLLSVEQIAARLDDRFRLLTGGSRTALPRQQTLRALIDWSYALLAEPERAFLQALSVFAGGWTLEAAEALLTDDERRTSGKDRGQATKDEAVTPDSSSVIHPPSTLIRPLDVLDLLTQLVNKSLVVVDHEQSGEPRYRLLETIRQYARDKLFDAERGDPARWRERHRRYFLGYAEQGEPELRGPRMVAWLNQFELEHDNFRAALEWALETDPLAAASLASALGEFWGRRGYVAEGLDWLERSLARLEAARLAGGVTERQYQWARARALGQRAWMDFGLTTNGPAARAAAEESAGLARQVGDERLLCRSLGALAMTAAFWGDPAQARAAAEEALALARRIGDTFGMAYALGGIQAVDLNHTFNVAEARQLQVESMRLARQLGNPWALGQMTQAAARLAVAEGDLDEARARFEESARLFSEVGDMIQMNGGRSDLAHALRRHGRTEEALALYHQTLRAWQHLGHRGAVAHQLESLAYIAMAQSQPARAARLLGVAEALRGQSGAMRMPIERTEYEQALASLRAQLAAAELEAAWAAGQAMAMDEAVEYALSEEPKPSGAVLRAP